MAKKKSLFTDYNKIENQILMLAKPLCAECGAELIDVEYVLENGSWYLRIFIDRSPAVDHALCEQVSEKIGAALDITDPIRQSYYLEVSSPGLERPLKRADDFRRYTGHEVAVRLYVPRPGEKGKEYRGILLGFDADGLHLQTVDGETIFAADEVAKVNLAADL